MTGIQTPTPTPVPPRAGKSAGQVVALVFGALLTLIGLGLVAAGGTVLWFNAQRDAAGYATSPTFHLSSSTAAITSGAVNLHLPIAGPGDAFTTTSKVRLQVDGTGRPTFIGVGRESDVAAWLAGHAYDEVTSLPDGQSARYVRHPGQQTALPAPASQGFWVASAAGPGPQTLSWTAQSGRWLVVIANADGSTGVDAQVRGGVKLPDLTGVGIGVTVGGVVLLAAGVTLVVVGARSRRS